MTVIIYGLFYRVSAKQTHESLKYGHVHRVRKGKNTSSRHGETEQNSFFPATNTTTPATSIHSICSIVLGPMDALTSRLHSNDIHPFPKLRQLEPLRINHLFDLRLIDTPVLMHVPNVSTCIQINVNTVLPQRVQGDAVWGRLTP